MTFALGFDARVQTMRTPYFVMTMIVWLCVALLLTGCGRGPSDAIIGVENPDARSASVPGVISHDIYVMTSRKPSGDPALMYSGGRSKTLGFARVTVTIPPAHQTGKVERPRDPPPDPAKHMTVIDPEIFANDSAFVADLNQALRRLPPADRSVLAFVHGYNTTYTDAVLRFGQFIEDTKFRGVPVLFSWASAGRLLDYVYDLNSALSARNDLVTAGDVLVRSQAHTVDLVAHSMGNLLTTEAMRQARVAGKFNSSGKLKNIILASADIDLDVFRDQMSVFDPRERRFYVLISADDKALATSRFLAHGVSRVGDADAEELAKLGVTVIDMTAVKDPGNLNHGKFSESPEVVQLIGRSIENGNSLNTSSDQGGLIGNTVRGVANAAYSVAGGEGQVFVLSGN